jgi:hypothetical protein
MHPVFRAGGTREYRFSGAILVRDITGPVLKRFVV